MGLGCGRSGGVSTAAARLLDGRTLYRAIRTEDTAVTCLGPEHDVTVSALVEIEASIGGHGFGGHEAALRTGEDGLEDRRRMHCLAPNGLANRRPATGAQPTHAGRPC